MAAVLAIQQFREYAVAGGLISDGISLLEGYRWVGDYTGRLLNGAKPPPRGDRPRPRSLDWLALLGGGD
jgi:hypothetical protein